jgi:P27 family predicted phage terminase small subunit
MRDETHMADGREVARVEVAVPIAEQPVPLLPVGLGDRGEKEWYQLWEYGRWLHPQEDYHWVEMLARAYDEIELYRKTIAEDGLISYDVNGKVQANPLIAEVRKAESVIMKCLSQLGFSPTDRARLGIAEVKRQTGLAKLQKANQQ